MEKITSKKGDLPDMLIFMVTLFVFAIGFIIIVFVVPSITSGLETAGLNNSAEGQASIDQLEDYATNGIQKGYFFLMVGLIMSMMITSFFALTNRIFLFLYIFFLGITLFIGAYLGNAYEQFISTDSLLATAASQGMINIVMQNIVLITLISTALSMIIIFGRAFINSGQSSGGGF